MPLPTDPDTLRIPAFMRKRSLSSRLKRPLVLTALDRKKAGILPDGLVKPKMRVKKIPQRDYPRTKSWPVFELPLSARAEKSQRTSPKKPSLISKSTVEKRLRIRQKSAPKKSQPKITPQTFAAPLLDFMSETIAPAPRKIRAAKVRTKKIQPSKIPKPKSIGTLTHYYGKIQVGVIKLSGTLSVGDCIRYETADSLTNPDEDLYEQVVDSMEIDREPVFKAGKGKEIGLKLQKTPRTSCTVFIA